jgi:transcriptional regulator with XRE-family HTH domain
MANTKRTPTILRRRREELKQSLERTAVAAGISVAWLRQLERDPTLLSARVAERLLPVLNLRPDEDLLPPRDGDGGRQGGR